MGETGSGEIALDGVVEEEAGFGGDMDRFTGLLDSCLKNRCHLLADGRRRDHRLTACVNEHAIGEREECELATDTCMAKLKAERHHWWPQCVSRYWADPDGLVRWLQPNGKLTVSAPRNFGVIGNGHTIRLSKNPAEASPWDMSFEGAFQTADNKFPDLIDWLNGLDRTDELSEGSLESRIRQQRCEDRQFSDLVECITSLAVRSPMHRERSVSLAEHLRGPLESRKREALIGLNIRNSLPNALRRICGRGKAMIVFSPKREFIFGDGFFNNFTPPCDHFLNPRMFAPLTPWMGVLYVLPQRCRPDPRLCTLVATAAEANDLNCALQVYAKNAVFYRLERPGVTDAFSKGAHLEFKDRRNPVDQLICQIPGVPRRDASWDRILDERRSERAE